MIMVTVTTNLLFNKSIKIGVAKAKNRIKCFDCLFLFWGIIGVENLLDHWKLFVAK